MAPSGARSLCGSPYSMVSVPAAIIASGGFIFSGLARVGQGDLAARVNWQAAREAYARFALGPEGRPA